MALKSGSQEIKDKIFKNISKRAAEMINDDLSSMGPVKLKDVEKAQQGVVDVARKLESEGKVSLAGGGEDEYI